MPLVGGLAGFAGAALRAGDCFIQTRRLVKVTLFFSFFHACGSCFVPQGLACLAYHDADERQPRPLVFFGRQITDLAPDAVECSKLAKSLALRLTDGLTDGTIAITYDAKERRMRHAAGVGWGAGESDV